ncbi:hypothetical protein PNOK_0040500 [Pyrrhoderma noxium]|uniref:Uncharacterized protein n=1 Tax=Pyrrhoderma noxium TaxID=2282107 RepID=A0A286UUS9_9AGAM|nr:hypothetical protein PNOK_0040500 [Pyrrhoderma noxium]
MSALSLLQVRSGQIDVDTRVDAIHRRGIVSQCCDVINYASPILMSPLPTTDQIKIRENSRNLTCFY